MMACLTPSSKCYKLTVRRVVAKLIGFHGIKGELKLYPLVDDLGVFDGFKQLHVILNEVKDPHAAAQEGGSFALRAQDDYDLLSWREHKGMVLVMLKGIKDLTHAEQLFQPKLREIYVEAELEEQLEAGEHYIEDLKGMTLLDAETGQVLGKVKTCAEGAQLILVVSLASANKELLVPYVAEYIIEVDAVARTIRARITDDLLELAS